MRVSGLATCNIGLFGKSIGHFLVSDLKGVLEMYPFLEHPYQHDFYTILFVEKADGQVIVDDQKIRVDDPKVIIIKPGCIASIYINRNARGKLISFTEDFFSLRYNNNILYQFSFLKRNAGAMVRLNFGQTDKWRILLQQISEEFEQNRRERNIVLRSFLNILLFELERIWNPVGIKREVNVKTDKVNQFEKLVEERYVKDKMPSEYAKRLHLSPNYLNKLCKEETGFTAGELIRKRVTIEAQRLLHYTSLSVNEIADKLGFENVPYFITFFKKQTKLTPEQFRKLD
ncbi:MAG: helix-turn-helix transcriptional regulator [Sediminibacterium sp.]|nr:helix-turn-helix transcriptional regulator [Sediminibacterium sp.]